MAVKTGVIMKKILILSSLLVSMSVSAQVVTKSPENLANQNNIKKSKNYVVIEEPAEDLPDFQFDNAPVNKGSNNDAVDDRPATIVRKASKPVSQTYRCDKGHIHNRSESSEPVVEHITYHSSFKTPVAVSPSQDPDTYRNGREFVTDDFGYTSYVPAGVVKANPTNILDTKYTIDFGKDSSDLNQQTVTLFGDHQCVHCKEAFKAIPDLVKNGYAVQYVYTMTDNSSASEFQNIYCSSNPSGNLSKSYQQANSTNFSAIPQRQDCTVDFMYLQDVSNKFKVQTVPTFYFNDYLLPFKNSNQLLSDLKKASQ